MWSYFFVKLKGETMVSRETSSITEINQKGVYSGFIGRRLFKIIRYDKAKELLSASQQNIGFKNTDGGIIVFPELSSTEMANWLKQKEMFNWTIGNYLDGKYKSNFGVRFDETSLCVQINNITSTKLKDIALKMCKDLRQGSVLVKDFSTNKIWGV